MQVGQQEKVRVVTQKIEPIPWFSDFPSTVQGPFKNSYRKQMVNVNPIFVASTL